MNIEKIDDKHFNTVETATTSYDVDDLYGEINTLNQRIAQLALNSQNALLAEITGIQAQIDTRTALLAEAQTAGVDTTPPANMTDSSAIIESATALQGNAGTILAE